MSNLITDPEDIRLREENEVQALLGHPPAWLTRWGITLVAIGVVGLLLIGTFLRYPDIVEAPTSIETEYPPIRLEAKVDGRIQQLLAASDEKVDSGELLVVLQNPIAVEDIAQVETTLQELLPALENKAIHNINLPSGLRLADLQDEYAALNSLLDAQRYLLAQDDIQQRIALLREQIRQLPALDAVTQKEVSTLRKEVELAEKNKNSFYDLWKSGNESEWEYERAEAEYLQVLRQLEAQERNLIQNRLDEQKLRGEIIILSRQQSDEIKNGWIELNKAAQEMQGVVDQWKDQYLIQAPVAGRVVLSGLWNENQPVNEGQTVLTIDPAEGGSPIIARARLPLARSGKVAYGDTVLLRLESYPYKEFGVLKGTVSEVTSLAEAPEPGLPPVYIARIELTSQDLITNYDKPLQFTQEMQATARIITEDRSFLARIMDELLSLFGES